MTIEKIGRYQISDELGRGAMGVVYRATDPSIGRTVAIKTIRLASHSQQDRDLHVERLRREAQSAGRLSHPHIVTIYDLIEADDAAYVCMEFVDGPSLETVLSSRQIIPRDEVIRMLKQAAEALDYAHSRGVVHRDIKPGNVLLSGGRDLKITDFGIAKLLSDDATMTGPMMGTPSYMSPEQVQSRPVGGRSDQFSLAVIAYELLTGEKPFNGYSVASIVYKVCNDNVPPPSTINPTLPSAVDTVFGRALAKDPALRFANVQQFASSLEQALIGADWKMQPRGAALLDQSSTSIPIATAFEQPKRRKRHAGLIAILSALFGFAIVAATFWLMGPKETPAPIAQPPVTAATQTETVNPPEAVTPPPPPPVESAKPSPAEEKPSAAEETEKEPATSEAPGAISAFPAPSTSLEAHDFSVETTPDAATVQVDNIPSFNCTTPCRLTLAGGRHTLKVEKEGYRSALRIIEIPSDESIRVSLDRAVGTVMVRSSPPGAAIFVDGREWGSKTPTMMTLPAGKHQVELRLEGYRNEDSAIVVRDGAVMNLDINWTNK